MKVITELNEQVEVSSPNEFVDVFRNIYARGSDKYSLRFSKQGLCALYDYFKETGVDPDVYNITQLYKEYDNVFDAARFFCFKVQGHEDPHAVEDADNFRAIWAWMNKHATVLDVFPGYLQYSDDGTPCVQYLDGKQVEWHKAIIVGY